MLSSLKKIYYFISKRQKRNLALLSFLLFFGMLLEFLGISILLPILEIVSNKDFRLNIFFIKYFPSSLKSNTDQEILFLFLSALTILYVLKTAFLAMLSFLQNRFVLGMNASIATKLYNLYLKQEYRYHLDKSSSTLSKNLITELNHFTFYINSLIVILTETLFISSIILCVIWIKPLSTFLVGLFFVVLAIIYFKISKRLVTQWGIDRKNLEDSFTITLHEGLRGIKDVKMYGITGPFIDKFKKEKSKKNFITAKYNTLNAFPRYFFELLSVLTLVFYLVIISISGQNLESIIPIIGVYVAAIFRVLPSVNKIVVSSQSLKFYEPAINLILNEFKEVKNGIERLEDNSKIKFHDSILIKNLSFSYKGNKKNILSDFNLEIRKGTTIGIKGTSGSGKSTFIDIFVSLHKPSQGQILVDGKSIFETINGWRGNIGYVSQFIFLSDTTIKENIAFGQTEKNIDHEQLRKVIKMAQLSTFIEELPNGIDTTVGEGGIQLSGGQKQRIGIARALFNNPEILVFDEATSALDKETEKEVMDAIYSLKGEKTIIVVAHRLSTLKKCDYIYKIDSGKLVLD